MTNLLLRPSATRTCDAFVERALALTDSLPSHAQPKISPCRRPLGPAAGVPLLDATRQAVRAAHHATTSSVCHCLTHSVKQCEPPRTVRPARALLECGHGASILFPQAYARPHSREWYTGDAPRQAVRTAKHVSAYAWTVTSRHRRGMSADAADTRSRSARFRAIPRAGVATARRRCPTTSHQNADIR